MCFFCSDGRIFSTVAEANKEIQKQQGGGMGNIDLYKPSNTERRRRPGILGYIYIFVCCVDCFVMQ